LFSKLGISWEKDKFVKWWAGHDNFVSG